MINSSLNRKKQHVPVLDPLRGIAALCVCLYHFTNGNDVFLSSGDLVKALGSYGWLGVEAFFVISGFVVPYSLHCRSYRIEECLGFFVRRLKRLEPPYLACIVLVIGLHWLSSLVPAFGGAPFSLTWKRLFAHCGYLNAFIGLDWLNPVFWTLAIEFQYYVLIAIVFPLLDHGKLWVRLSSVSAGALLGFGGFGGHTIIHWLPLFAVGIVTFQFYVGILSNSCFLLQLLWIAAVSGVTIGMSQTVVGVCTALIVLFCAHRKPPAIFVPFAFLGTISYSLYLIHVPVGGRVINLATRLPEWPALRYSAVLVALCTSVFFAVVFWWFIERPSQRWSKDSKVAAVPISSAKTALRYFRRAGN